ncbi:12167_t:CDS:2 [Ambispora leptoticha]|uniref:12167_t:CDS:1 n=1 Tax=Ambispora leptoticha TaxID=144679 RepID=A0A9N8VQL0_9GLOM|nr:12167_t:CDS:2 [Ambispora leptoticha]
MVSPTNTLPEAETAVANGGDHIKPSNATNKHRSILPDQPAAKSVNATPIKSPGNVVTKAATTNGDNRERIVVENNDSHNDGVNGTFKESDKRLDNNNTNGSNAIANGKNSEVKQWTNVTATAAVTEPNNDEINNDNEKISSSVETKETQSPIKTPIPAPIPPVNYWEMRMQNAKKVPATSSTITTIDSPSSSAAVADKEKGANENSERRQSVDVSKKEDSPKRGKGKWIPYELPITHSTPLPNHGQKHRRRSEDSVPHTGTRERRTFIEKPFSNNAESVETSTTTMTTSPSVSSSQQNGNSNPRRRASVPPPNGRDQYSRRYSQSAVDNGQLSHHMNNLSFRGGRRGGGRSRPFNGTRSSPRSTSFSYSTGFPQQYGSLFTAKMPPYVYDIELLKYYILQQIEYYFSIENLCKDLYLRSNMDAYGFVDISLLANFNRVRLLTLDENLVREALLHSYIVEVSGDKARKRDGWEMWVLPNQNQQNINEHALAESTYNNDSLVIEEYDEYVEDNDTNSIDDEKKETQELQEQPLQQEQDVVIANTIEKIPTTTSTSTKLNESLSLPSSSSVTPRSSPNSTTPTSTTTTYTHNITNITPENFEPLTATASR